MLEKMGTNPLSFCKAAVMRLWMIQPWLRRRCPEIFTSLVYVSQLPVRDDSISENEKPNTLEHCTLETL